MHIYTITHRVVPNSVRDLLSLAFRFVLAINVPLICWAIYLSLSILEILSTIAETLSSWLFESFSPIFGLKACQTSSIQASAVLIVGADDTGVGRRMALKFSELGYTVFAIYPTGRLPPSSSSPTRKPSDVSSLLYAWHHKKERLPELPWGIIAPLSLDTSSKAERTHAFATIDAYCTHHSLQLVALIALPFSGYYGARRMLPVNPGNSNSGSAAGDDYDERVYPLHIAQEDVLKDLIFRDILEPVLLTQHYVGMMGKVSGRVIMISQDSDGSIHSPGELSRRAFARTLRAELEPMRIRVASIITGPLSVSSTDDINAVKQEDRSNYFERIRDIYHQGSNLQQVIRRTIDSFAIREDVLFHAVLRIVQSRYPKFEHVLGVHPIVASIANISLATVRWILRC